MDKLPYDLNAEACILSAMMIDETAIIQATAILEEDMFYKTSHRYIFRNICSLFNDNIKVDIVTLADCLKNNKQLRDVGGLDFLNDLSEVVLNSSNINYHIKIIIDISRLRKLSLFSQRTIENVRLKEKTADEIIENAQTEILTIKNVKTKPFKHVNEIAENMINRKQRIIDGLEKEEKYYTGLMDIDRLIDLKRGKLLVIGAKKSVGKSVLANNIGFLNARSRGAKVGIFNMEMTEDEILEREVCRTGKITLTEATHPDQRILGYMTDELINIQEHDIMIDETVNQSVVQIRSKSMQMKHMMKGLDIIIVDYIQLMKPLEGDNREQRVSSIIRGLKHIAKELKILVVALTQLNKDHEARESKSIEQDADVMFKIIRPKFEQKDDVPVFFKGNKFDITSKFFTFIDIEKNRQGKTDTIEYWFDGDHQRFIEYNGQML